MTDSESSAATIVASIAATKLAPLAEELKRLLAPSIRVGVLSVSADELPLGASRFGGLPDLPHSIAWPRGANRPLSLAAQIHLTELAELDPWRLLPASGWLYFFFDACDESPFEAVGSRPPAWQVLYFDGERGQLQRQEAPVDADPRGLFPACALGFATEWNLPSYGSTLLDGLELPVDYRDEYEALVFSLHAAPPLPAGYAVGPVKRLLGKLRHRWIGDPIHRMLGHPEHFQQDPRLDWERLAAKLPLTTATDAALRRAAEDWRLLLQLDAYEAGPNWLWGDSGTMYFGLRTDDLAARRFDQAQWTVECG